MRTYAITGATGNTGKIVASKLLEEGHKVRVIGRSPVRLAPLVEKRAEPRVGSVDDLNFLTKAFTDADAVYAMIPSDVTVGKFRDYQNKLGRVIASAVENSAVENVVFLSSLAAHLSGETGPIAGLHDVEEQLNKMTNVNVLHLRPAFFMENFFGSIGTIRNMGVAGMSIRGDIAFPMIATQDIGRYAAQRLSKLDFTGHSARELLGARDYTLEEATTILGNAIGKEDLSYTQFSYQDSEKAFLAMGVSPDCARSYVEMAKAFNDGIIKGVEARSGENTTPTSLEDFAGVFAAAYNAG